MSLRFVSARAAVASLLLSTAYLAGCGSSSSDSPPPPPPPPAEDALWVVPDAVAPLTAAQRTAFTDGNLYVNAHTTAHGTGELRGQLDHGGTTIRLASLNRVQEGLPATTTEFGAGILQVDTSTGTATSGKMRGFVITSGLANISAAHVHQAVRGTTGDPVIDLVRSDANRDLWVVPDDAPALTADQVTAFLAGELYYNVHTQANPTGDIRGQLDKSGTIRLASLDAAQEPTGVVSTALGAGIVAVDEATGAVSGFAVTTSFASAVNNAHIHGPADRGTNVGTFTGMRFGPKLAVVPDDASPLTAPQRAEYLLGRTYLNVHTATNGGGEIRGQLDKTGTVRVAAMNGAQETPAPITTTGAGAGLVAVDGATGQVSGFILTRGLVGPTIAHIHQAARGTGGGPIVDLVKP